MLKGARFGSSAYDLTLKISRVDARRLMICKIGTIENSFNFRKEESQVKLDLLPTRIIGIIIALSLLARSVGRVGKGDTRLLYSGRTLGAKHLSSGGKVVLRIRLYRARASKTNLSLSRCISWSNVTLHWVAATIFYQIIAYFSASDEATMLFLHDKNIMEAKKCFFLYHLTRNLIDASHCCAFCAAKMTPQYTGVFLVHLVFQMTCTFLVKLWY